MKAKERNDWMSAVGIVITMGIILAFLLGVVGYMIIYH